jgi:SLT domain-containing protein
MQTIPSTFRENALPGYDQNIKDPLSNLIAGIRYSVKRYGSLSEVPGVASIAKGGEYKPVGSVASDRDTTGRREPVARPVGTCRAKAYLPVSSRPSRTESRSVSGESITAQTRPLVMMVTETRSGPPAEGRRT